MRPEKNPVVLGDGAVLATHVDESPKSKKLAERRVSDSSGLAAANAARDNTPVYRESSGSMSQRGLRSGQRGLGTREPSRFWSSPRITAKLSRVYGQGGSGTKSD